MVGPPGRATSQVAALEDSTSGTDRAPSTTRRRRERAGTDPAGPLRRETPHAASWLTYRSTAPPGPRSPGESAPAPTPRFDSRRGSSPPRDGPLLLRRSGWRAPDRRPSRQRGQSGPSGCEPGAARPVQVPAGHRPSAPRAHRGRRPRRRPSPTRSEHPVGPTPPEPRRSRRTPSGRWRRGRHGVTATAKHTTKGADLMGDGACGWREGSERRVRIARYGTARWLASTPGSLRHGTGSRNGPPRRDGPVPRGSVRHTCGRHAVRHGAISELTLRVITPAVRFPRNGEGTRVL